MSIENRPRKIARALLLSIVGGFLLVGSAYAHAEYLRSEPGSGAVVAAAPERVDIWFTQEVFRRQGENRIQVLAPGEQPVQAGEVQIDDDDRKHIWILLQPGLQSGEYRVEWRSLSAEDGDTDEGVFSFILDPQAAVTSTPMGAAAPTKAPAASPTLPALVDKPTSVQDTSVPAPTVTDSQEGPGGGSCLPGLLPVGGLVGATLLYRRRKPMRA